MSTHSAEICWNREYTKRFVLERDRIRGQQHGLQYCEYFHYVGGGGESSLQTYIRENAVSL